jgi:hypothetical protein
MSSSIRIKYNNSDLDQINSIKLERFEKQFFT